MDADSMKKFTECAAALHPYYVLGNLLNSRGNRFLRKLKVFSILNSEQQQETLETAIIEGNYQGHYQLTRLTESDMWYQLNQQQMEATKKSSPFNKLLVDQNKKKWKSLSPEAMNIFGQMCIAERPVHGGIAEYNYGLTINHFKQLSEFDTDQLDCTLKMMKTPAGLAHLRHLDFQHNFRQWATLDAYAMRAYSVTYGVMPLP